MHWLWRSCTSSDDFLQNKGVSKQTFQSLLEASSEEVFVYLHMHSDCINQLKWRKFLQLPWGIYQWCVVHGFLLRICWGKPLPVLIDKVRPTGTVGDVPFWTVLNWCPVLLSLSLWTMWFMCSGEAKKFDLWGQSLKDEGLKAAGRKRKEKEKTDYISSQRSFHGRLGNGKGGPNDFLFCVYVQLFQLTDFFKRWQWLWRRICFASTIVFCFSFSILGR